MKVLEILISGFRHVSLILHLNLLHSSVLISEKFSMEEHLPKFHRHFSTTDVNQFLQEIIQTEYKTINVIEKQKVCL